MKIVSWNLNGLLSTLKNGAMGSILSANPDVICLQEIRTQQEPIIAEGYFHIWNHSQRDGYAGTAMLSKQKPVCIRYGFDDGDDAEGRTITAEFEKCFIVNTYVPNSQQNLQRHAYRMQWDEDFREYICRLKEEKKVIICGDFNVARTDLDIYPENIRQYWAEQGYASDERSNFETLLECGFVDAFRHLHPDQRSYTWWSNRLNKRQQDRGWRLDYFLVDDELLPDICTVNHMQSIYGSDHCPIFMEVCT